MEVLVQDCCQVILIFTKSWRLNLLNFSRLNGALLFNSGYDANIGLLSSVPQRGDRIFYDEFSHASIRDGIRLSHAKAFGFRHNDLDDLQQKIKATDSEGEVYVVVESVYSMDGDQAPLRELSQLSEPLNFKLIVDEAHATGVYGLKGQGIVVEQELEADVFARIHTFGKALGCHGAIIARRSFTYSIPCKFCKTFYLYNRNANACCFDHTICRWRCYRKQKKEKFYTRILLTLRK